MQYGVLFHPYFIFWNVFKTYVMHLNKYLPMIAFSLMTLIFAGSTDANKYEKAWKEVQEAINKGIPKTALEKVEAIYILAKKERNDEQIIKATLYKTRLVLQTEELGLEQVVTDLEKAISENEPPTKQILQSFTAELFESYFRNQYYKISQRTDIADFVAGDIRTWAPNNYRDYIGKAYIASLEGEEIKQIKSEEVKTLLRASDNINYDLRPTLRDLLRDRALTYFKRNNVQGIQPSFKFTMTDAKYLGTSAEYGKLTIESADPKSLLYKAALLFQEAINENANNEDALLAYNLDRISFVRQHSNIPNKELIYETTLRQEIANAKNDNIKAEYMLQLAANVVKDKVKSIAIYEEVLSMKVDDNFKTRAENAIANIKKPTLTLQSESVYTSGENLLFNLSHNNLEKVYFKIVKFSQNDLKKFYENRRNGINEISNLTEVRAWEMPLTTEKKYEQESREFTTEQLPFGSYALITSNKSSLNIKSDAFVYTVFHVSNIASVVSRESGSNNIRLLNRKDGKPLQNVTAEFYEQKYNRTKRNQERIFEVSKKSDKNGLIDLSKMQIKNKSYVVIFRQGEDVIDLNTNMYFNSYKNERRTDEVDEIFTDRSIYRPGQTIHYKLLSLRKDNYSRPSISVDTENKVTLYDANGQEVSSQIVRTNDYGSASGTFTIPTGLLTGSYRLESNDGSQYIQVEEYKRPKFEVKLDDSNEKIVLGDQVKVSGVAIALSGSPVTEGKVVYTIKRYTQYSWWSWYRSSRSNEIMIKQGELLTGTDGKFDLTFDAMAEADMDSSKNPRYTFEINIDVTDVSGETRSTVKRISITTLPYGYDITLKTTEEYDDLSEVKLEAKNAQNQNVDSKATLTISELKQPSEWQKKRYWQQSNTNGAWRNKIERIEPTVLNALENYEIKKEIASFPVDINHKTLVDLKNYLQPGRAYEVSLKSQEKAVDDIYVTAQKRFVTVDSKRGIWPTKELLFIGELDKDYKVGKAIDVTLGTPDGEVEVYYYFMRDWEVVGSGKVCVDNKTKISYTPTLADQGGISLQLYYVKHNRYFSDNISLPISWDEKKLNVELVTQRDKVVPGSDEEWTIKIKGSQKDKVAAEMLATMYDASLDQIKWHGYNADFYADHYGALNLNTYGFNQAGNIQGNYNWNRVVYKPLSAQLTPSLRGLDYYGYGGRRRMKKSRAMSSRDMGGAPMPTAQMEEAEMSNDDMDKKGMRSYKTSVLDVDEIGQLEGKVSGVGSSTENSIEQPPSISPRTNLKETVFFYPHLKTDGEGNILLTFKMNEALTRWKLLTFAHDKELRYGMTSHEVKTQKDLMIIPNAPRFLREGDTMLFPANVSNLTDKAIDVNANLSLINPITGNEVDALFGHSQKTKKVIVPANQTIRIDWKITVPDDYKGLLSYTVKAWNDKHTDGEENVLPILTNKMLVTESEVLSVKGKEEKTYTIKPLENTSATAQPHSYTLEYTSNPVWYAVQALPYLMEYPYNCTEQVFNRFYANKLASHIANANPKIKAIFETWKTTDSDALVSNLEKNKELEYALLEESPWVRNAQSESEQKKRIALLFDINKMANEGKAALKTVRERQLPDGSFPWFTGGRGDEYITQLIVSGMAQLQHLGIIDIQSADYTDVITRALNYLDEKSKYRYEHIVSKKHDNLDYRTIQYLYISL